MNTIKRIIEFMKVSLEQTIGPLLRIAWSFAGHNPGKVMVRKVLKVYFGWLIVYMFILVCTSVINEYMIDWAVIGDKSMSPAMKQNHLCLYKPYTEDTNINFGDIIITRITNNQTFIKEYEAANDIPLELLDVLDLPVTYGMERVLGLPGDTVKIENGQIYVNGSLIDGSTFTSNPNDTLTYEEFIVEDNSYFSLPDNRSMAEIDFVRHTNIIGIVY